MIIFIINMAKTAFILLIGLAFALAAPSKNVGWRIIGGNKADEGQFPYQVSIRIAVDYYACGGSIIDETTILTAAYCIVDYFSYIVVTGSNQLDKGGDIYEVEKFIIHPDYDQENLINDIALLKLSKPIKFNEKVAPIQLENGKIGNNETCVLSGWGMTSFPGAEIPSNDLQFLNLKTYDQELCKELYHPTYPVWDSEICTLTKKGEGACRGDLGGPVVSTTTGKQIGLLSWAIPCAKGKPDVHTRIESYIDWINANK